MENRFTSRSLPHVTPWQTQASAGPNRAAGRRCQSGRLLQWQTQGGTTSAFRRPLRPRAMHWSCRRCHCGTTSAFRRPLRRRHPQPAQGQHLASAFASTRPKQPSRNGLERLALAKQRSTTTPPCPPGAHQWPPGEPEHLARMTTPASLAGAT